MQVSIFHLSNVAWLKQRCHDFAFCSADLQLWLLILFPLFGQEQYSSEFIVSVCKDLLWSKFVNSADLYAMTSCFSCWVIQITLFLLMLICASFNVQVGAFQQRSLQDQLLHSLLLCWILEFGQQELTMDRSASPTLLRRGLLLIDFLYEVLGIL